MGFLLRFIPLHPKHTGCKLHTMASAAVKGTATIGMACIIMQWPMAVQSSQSTACAVTAAWLTKGV
jgi:hypothetical protein